MLKYAMITDNGSRDINEDAVGWIQLDGKSCFILCDGLGGHGMGDIASKYVVNAFVEAFKKPMDTRAFLTDAFMRAQLGLMQEQERLHATSKMKTTAVALVTDGKNAYIGHVGDSRLYVFKDCSVKCRTLDHSIPQMLVLTHEIKESEIRNHPNRNIVLRVMGVEWDEPKFELMKPIPLKKCSAFLLCSDGFWELIEEDDMCRMLKESDSPEEWLKKMAARVKENGLGKKTDNYSAIAIWKE